MNEKETKHAIKRLIICLLISFPVAYLFMKTVALKYTNLFRFYIAIMAFTALITEWNEGEPYDMKSKFVQRCEDILVITFLGMVVWYISTLLNFE